jgi:hypothetical protein
MNSFNPTSGAQKDLVTYIDSLDLTQDPELLAPKLHMATQLAGRVIAVNGQLDEIGKASIESLKQKITTLLPSKTSTVSKIASKFFKPSSEATELKKKAVELANSLEMLEGQQGTSHFSDKELIAHFSLSEMTSDAINIIENSPNLSSADRVELYSSDNPKVLGALKKKDSEELASLLQEGNVDNVSSFLKVRPESIRQEFILDIIAEGSAPDKDLVHYFVAIESIADAVSLIATSPDLSSTDKLELFAKVITDLPKDQEITDLLKTIPQETYNTLLKEAKKTTVNIPQALRVSLHNMLEAQKTPPITKQPKTSLSFFQQFFSMLTFSSEAKSPPAEPKLTPDVLAQRNSEILPKEDAETASETSSFSSASSSAPSSSDATSALEVEAAIPVEETRAPIPTTLDELAENVSKELSIKGHEKLEEALEMQKKMKAAGKGEATASAVVQARAYIVGKAQSNGETLGSFLKALCGNKEVAFKQEDNGTYTVTLPSAYTTKPTGQGVADASDVEVAGLTEKATAMSLLVEIPQTLNFSLSIDSIGDGQQVNLTFNDPQTAIFAKLPIVGRRGIKKVSYHITPNQDDPKLSASTGTTDKKNPTIWKAKAEKAKGKESKKPDPIETTGKAIPFLNNIWTSKSLKEKRS